MGFALGIPDLDHDAEVLDVIVQHRLDDSVFVWEVMVEETARHVDRFGDVLDGGVADALRLEELACRSNDFSPSLLRLFGFAFHRTRLAIQVSPPAARVKTRCQMLATRGYSCIASLYVGIL